MKESHQPERTAAIDQWSFTAPFEGVVPHLYRDTSIAGHVTCGVGFLLRNEAECAALPWLPSVHDAIGDFKRVRVAPRGKKASYYKPLCHAYLAEPAIRVLFAGKMTRLRSELEHDWHLSALPASVQVALVDMAYNLGVAGLARYAQLRAAVDARDWRTAAAECYRRGIQLKRNEGTQKLFMSSLADTNNV